MWHLPVYILYRLLASTLKWFVSIIITKTDYKINITIKLTVIVVN
jgi:hypothetical protein